MDTLLTIALGSVATVLTGFGCVHCHPDLLKPRCVRCHTKIEWLEILCEPCERQECEECVSHHRP